MKTKIILLILCLLLFSCCSTNNSNFEENYRKFTKLQTPEVYKLAFTNNRELYDEIKKYMVFQNIDPIAIYYENWEYEEEEKLKFNKGKEDITDLFAEDDLSVFYELSSRLNIISYYKNNHVIYFTIYLKHNEINYVYSEGKEPSAAELYHLGDNWYLTIDYYE